MMKARIYEDEVSQMVILPKEYRFLEDEVIINKIGDVVILMPETTKW